MAHLRSHRLHPLANFVAIVAATLAALAGCSKSPSPEHKSEAPAPAVNVEWTKFVDEFIEAYFVANPTFAVASGRHEFDGHIAAVVEPPVGGRGLTEDNAEENTDDDAEAVAEEHADERQEMDVGRGSQ